MVTLLSEQLGCEIFCVHRLDTATGGVMVYAKSSRSAGLLTASLSSETTVKEYLCVCRSSNAGQGIMEDLLFHDKRKNKAYIVDRERKGVKIARLSYESLATDGERSLVKVRLYTGRTHQIRVQFASRKMPLLGDGKYGARDNLPLALHCFHLAFDHPFAKERIDVCALPESPWFSFGLDNIAI